MNPTPAQQSSEVCQCGHEEGLFHIDAEEAAKSPKSERYCCHIGCQCKDFVPAEPAVCSERGSDMPKEEKAAIPEERCPKCNVRNGHLTSCPLLDDTEDYDGELEASDFQDSGEVECLRNLVRHEIENRLEEKRKKKAVSKLYGETLKKNRALEAERDQLQKQLKAMTVDRNLWQDEHEGDCPVQALLETAREERDKAWNEAIEAAAVRADDFEGDPNAIPAIRSLARPIPAEPRHD